MAIPKSEIIGKSLLDLYDFIKGISGSNIPHCEWKPLPTKYLDFIAKCTLRYANSYGAKYKIDSNHELTVKHTTNGQAYTLESYKKLFDMVITDYDDSTQSSQEQPMSTPQDIKVGSHWERIRYSGHVKKGEIVIVEEADGDMVYFNKNRNLFISEFLERFIPRLDLDTITSTPTDKRNLAFYKESGEPWTEEELDTVRNYYGDTSSRFEMPSSTTKRKYAYWHDGSNEVKVYLWEDQTKPKQLEQVSYESLFVETQSDSTSCEFTLGDLIYYNQEARDKLGSAKGTLPNEIIGNVTKVIDRTKSGSTPLLEYKTIHGKLNTIDSGWVTKYVATPTKNQTTKPKPKPVTRPEPIQLTTKEKPMAQKPTIKDTAVTLVAANKDAAILAAKLEAGKILNKQVIKLIKPKLHPLVRGYADSPLASVVLANIVGFAIKQYAGDNAKAGQLAEMMLQASAVESISALNVDSLIDELLSSVKLPKAVRAELNGLDDDYE